ncbi:MAG: alpha-glucosidase/alpha-galactosidase [Halanaerobiales bacterium]
MDIMAREVLQDSVIALCDIHSGRLNKIKEYVKNTIKKYNLPTKVEASTDRKELLPDADFVITSISAGGAAYSGYPFKYEVEIPRKYGIDQSVADTCSVGAVFRFLRTAPVHLQIFRDIEELCPEALVLNHTNPMAMLTWMHHEKTSVENVGLCHGVQGTSNIMAEMIGESSEEISYKTAGINHLAWFLSFTKQGKDLYPELRKVMNNPEESARPDLARKEKVRFEIMRQFGYFPTESSRHDSEYMPYFRQNAEWRDKYNLELRDIKDNPRKREWMEEDEDNKLVGELKRSREYTTGIMEAVLTDKPYRFNGNVMNNGGLISNLPDNCCVEVPCMADANGINPCYTGKLPAQLAALDMSNVSVQELAVQAFLEKDKEAAFHACTLSPMTSATLTLPEIRDMFNELWEAEKDLLLWFDPSHTGPVPELCAE